jgi:hypothetical protein
MIKVIRAGEVKPGVFRYRGSVDGQVFGGQSRQPLLDACRKIKSIDEGTLPGGIVVGLYREGCKNPDVSCSLDWGADHTIEEGDWLKVRKYKAFDPKIRNLDKRAV